MKKKLIILSLIILMCIPVKITYKDGGTVCYRAVLWEIKDNNRLSVENGIHGYIVGKTYRLFFFSFGKTWFQTESNRE